MGEADTRVLVRRVLEHTAKLPPELRSDILARGAEAVGPLVELLQDDSLALETAPGAGYAPVHAVELLARLRAPEGIAPLVRALSRREPGELLYDALLYGLEELGAAVVPAALEALADERTPEARFGLLSVLARSGVRDERIFTALLAQLQEEPAHGAMNLARYGAPGALEPLKRALDAYPLGEDAEDLFANQAIIELEAAIERLGGGLSESQREKCERARRSRHRLGTMFRRVLEELKCHLGGDSR
jgi:hypothetical protein